MRRSPSHPKKALHRFWRVAALAALLYPAAAQTPQSAAPTPPASSSPPNPGAANPAYVADPVNPANPDSPQSSQTQQALPPPQGQILIQSHGEPPSLSGTPATTPGTVQPLSSQTAADQTATADLTDADRGALLITSYDLDARLRPADAGLSVRAQIELRNTAATPLRELALQISSSLHWEGAALVTGGSRTPLPLAQHRLETDADHTGAETELILTLPEPLASGASVKLDLFYSGTVPASTDRLQRLGAGAVQAQAADWDAISPAWTGLRGFGNVLWYPVASPQLFFAEGNALFQAVGQTRLREQDASIRLRLSLEYSGEAPVAAYFCGRRQPFSSLSDSPDSPISAGTGIATANFAAERMGFRAPNLFVLVQPEVFADPPGTQTAVPANSQAPSPDSKADPAAAPSSDSSSDSSVNTSQSNDSAAPPAPAAAPVQPLLRRLGGLNDAVQPFLALEAADGETVQGFTATAYRASALLREWLGPQPLSALTAIEHGGQPFEDGPLLVAPLSALASPGETSILIQSLTHAWVQTGQPWMDDGLAQFFALLSIERQDGREVAIAQLTELMKPVALEEPDPTAKVPAANAEPLIAASSDLIYRRKAAAVWWMLRGIVGDGNLHAALSAWRLQPPSLEPAAAQAIAFQHLLERLSHQELGWFFTDWVLHDKGLPDLTISDVTVSPEVAGAGHGAGWLVAVTVRNEGGAVADVPLTVLSGPTRIARRMRIGGQSTVTDRVFLETEPTAVTLNDGATPEERISTHTSEIHLRTR